MNLDVKGTKTGKTGAGKTGAGKPNGTSAHHHTYAPAKTNTLEGWPSVKGLDLGAVNAGKGKSGAGTIDIGALLESYASTGFQATNLSTAVDIIKQMRKEKATIILTCTSNMITSGLRDVIRYLVEHKMIDALVTSAGGVEEDIIKAFKPFVIGTFDASGKMLYNEGVNRSGNVFVPNDRYVTFEDFIDPILDELYERQTKSGKALDSCELIVELGSRLEKAAGKSVKGGEGGAVSSIVYWAAKNKIPIFCPCITDGSLGDLIFFQKQRHPNFQIDITGDMYKIVKLCLNADKTGVICLGGSTPKHYALNAQLFRDGADFAVYVNTGSDYDGSDSGAKPDEAISWGKIKAGGKSVKVTADATLVFPLIVAGAFS